MNPGHGSAFHRKARLPTGLAFALLLLLRAAWAVAALPPCILVVTSYHQGDAWTDREVAGFQSAFAPDAARIFVEHLDTRRLPEAAGRPEFADYLRAKYRDVPITLLVAMDDAALDFWVANRERLFPDLPLVFCGANDFTPDRLAGQANVTGVAESPDILGTLELALDLWPGIRTVVALGGDQGRTSQANLDHFRRAMTALGRRARNVEVINADLEGARAALAVLPADSTVAVRLAPLLGVDRIPLPIDADISALAATAPVPIFVLWDFDLGTGAVGGRVIRGESQGRAAATLARRILSGTPASTLPVTRTPTEAVLDYQVLGRFGRASADVPAGTLFLNAPASPYERYKTAIWCGLAILAVSLPASFLLAFALIARRRADTRLAESEGRYRELVENARSLILRFDADERLVFVNEYAEKLLGYSREELLAGEVSFWPSAPANLPGLLARALAAPETLAGTESENAVTTRDGRQLYLRWDSRVLAGDDGRPGGWLVVGMDITARRLAEDALAARILAEEELSSFGRELLAGAPGVVEHALRHLLAAISVDRAAWFVNCSAPGIGPCCRLSADVCLPGLAPQTGNPALELIPYGIDGFRWSDIMAAGDTISGLPGEFPENQRGIFAHFGIQAVLAAPVTVNGVWNGFLAVGDTRLPRRFSRFEQTYLITAASLLSAYLSRPDA